MEIDKNAEIEKYLTQLATFTSDIDRELFDKIVTLISPTIGHRDGSMVSCSDQSELDTVINGFAYKHLGLEKEEAIDAVKVVCEKMSSTKFKYRSVFYYLLSKNTGTFK